MPGLEPRGFIESLVPFLLEFRASLSDDKCENVAPSVITKQLPTLLKIIYQLDDKILI